MIQRIINIEVDIKPATVVSETDFLLPDNAQAITGVMVCEIAQTKSPLKLAVVHLSNEQINGAFYSATIGSFQTGNSVELSGGFKNNANTITLPKTSYNPVFVPVKGGDRIRVNVIADTVGGVWMDGKIFISLRYLEKKHEH